LTEDDKRKVLDLRMSKEEQKKLFNDPKVAKFLTSRKYKVTIKDGNKIRYMYGDDPVILEGYARANGLTILRTDKIE